MDIANESTFLEFTSWWTEVNPGGVVGSSSTCLWRRYVYIKYNILDGTFAVTIDNDCNTYFLPVIHSQKTSDPILVWDLYLGAQIDILGKRTTLHQCSYVTVQWNKYWRNKLVPIKDQLIKELKKYKILKLDPVILKPPAEHCNLRLLMAQIIDLQEKLREYRPRKADLLGVPQEMYEIEMLRNDGQTKFDDM